MAHATVLDINTSYILKHEQTFGPCRWTMRGYQQDQRAIADDLIKRGSPDTIHVRTLDSCR
jgi:hypothetical protein